MRLQTQIALLLVPLIVVPISLLGWFAFDQLRDTTQRRTLNQAAILIDQLDREFHSVLQSAVASTKVVSEFALVQRYMNTQDKEERYLLMQPTLLRLLTDFQNTYPDYYEIRILLPDGYEDLRAVNRDLPNKTDDESQNPFFQELRTTSEPYLTRIMRNPDNGEMAILIGRALYYKDLAVNPILAQPKLRGYLVFTIDTAFLRTFVRNHTFGATGELLLTDAQGGILFHSDADQIGRVIPQPNNKQINADRESMQPVTVAYRENASEKRMLRLGRAIDDRLHVFAQLDEAEFFAAGRHLGLIALGLVTATVLITVVLLYLFLHRFLVQPVQSLNRAAEQIGRGNLNVELDVRGKGEIASLARTFREMGQSLLKSDERIRYLAYHDGLTSLPNRTLFNMELARAVAQAARRGTKVALMYLDVDNFKWVNDTLGHEAGDQLLEEVARRLKRVVRREDLVVHAEESDLVDSVARLGGDEFTILLVDVHSAETVSQVAQRIMETLAEPLSLHNHTLTIGASIGISLYPDDANEASLLVRNADIAMYHAKQLGRNNYQFYAASMNIATIERLAMENNLRRALAEEQFHLVYQPIFDLASGELIGAEALLRWEDPDYGLIGPDRFIPIAEEIGLIVPIGEWVLTTACKQNRRWQAGGLKPIFVSVNISSIQVNRADLDRVVEQVLETTGLGAKYLDLEVTETSIMSANPGVVDMLQRVRSRGVRVSLDDFGTGYSSLSYLRRFPIDILKIDRSFVQDIAEDQDDEAIISAIIAMGRSLNMEVIAEGIETGKQLDFLRQSGCHLGQGFYLSQPVSAADFESILTEDRPKWVARQ